MGASKEMFMQELGAEDHGRYLQQITRGFVGEHTTLHYQCQDMLFAIQNDKIRLLAAKALVMQKADQIPEEFREDSEQWKQAVAEYNGCKDVLLSRHYLYNELIKKLADTAIEQCDLIISDKPAALTNGEPAVCN